MTQLTIIAHITAKTDKINFVKTELEKLIGLTRKEEGCLQYDLYQDNENPSHFMFFENWQSHELWQKHINAQHLKDFQTTTKDAIDSFTVNQMTRTA